MTVAEQQRVLAELLAPGPDYWTSELQRWSEEPWDSSPLSLLAMARYDTTLHRWRNVSGTGAAAQMLLAVGADVNGVSDDRETPLITAASYGDADVAAVLIEAGADVDTLSSHDSGGVPQGSAVLHAAVFGMTEVLNVLAAAGAQIRSLEEAAACGEISDWLNGSSVQARIRALVMATDHQRVGVIRELFLAGTPVDEVDEEFGRHPLRLAATNGRPKSVKVLLELGADRTLTDAAGLTALDNCRLARAKALDETPYVEVERLLTP
jgi:uncharacterized protein